MSAARGVGVVLGDVLWFPFPEQSTRHLVLVPLTRVRPPSLLTVSSMILARNALKNAVVTISEDGTRVVRTRRAAAVSKPSKLRNPVVIAEARDTSSDVPATAEATLDAPFSFTAESPSSDSDDVDVDKVEDATPTSGVTSISTTSSNDSDDEFEVKPDDVLLEAPPTADAPEGTKRATVARQPTPFEVPSMLSHVLSFCPIKPTMAGVAEAATTDAAAVTAPSSSDIIVAHEDDLDIGSSVETVTSGTPSDGCWLSATTTPDVSRMDASTPVTAATATDKTAGPSAAPSSGAKPALKNARVRMLAAETENLPSPKQPKSPVVGVLGGLTPTSSTTAGHHTPGSGNGGLPPCDSPTLPSAVFSSRGGAFSRRVFRRYSTDCGTGGGGGGRTWKPFFLGGETRSLCGLILMALCACWRLVCNRLTAKATST